MKEMTLKELFQKYNTAVPEDLRDVMIGSFFDEESLDPNQRRPDDNDSLLHSVAFRGDTEDLNFLIDAGADVNAVGDIGLTPLHYVASRGEVEMVQRLIESGADPKIRNEFGETAATWAEYHGHVEIARLLSKTSE